MQHAVRLQLHFCPVSPSIYYEIRVKVGVDDSNKQQMELILPGVPVHDHLERLAKKALSCVFRVSVLIF